MRLYYIDGNNVIGKDPVLKSIQKTAKQNSREQLVFKLERWKAGKNVKIVLFFDGHRGDGVKVSNFTVFYSGNKTADSLIKEEIGNYKNPKTLIVVSSDNEIFNFAKKCSCTTMKSEEFIFLLNKPVKSAPIEKPEIHTGSIDEFKKIFGVD
ncbi:MAG: NYN domain-containing protein [Ignavibacteriaceae bacterium]|nr:NYN domain-containing protein [Ignavibacteriaceae bacterium]